MAFFNVMFHSDALGIASSMNVIVPQHATSQIGMDSSGGKAQYPVLYLLHGYSDDHTIWARRTSIERYCASKDLIVVMPAGARSFYTDMAYGDKYWTFISEELPKIVAGFFPVSSKREDTFAAGLSMGGYGAFKLGLRKPDRYAACAALSPVADINHFRKTFLSPMESTTIFGQDPVTAEDCDLFKLVEKTAALPKENLPRLLHICGTEDFMYKEGLALRNKIQALNAFDYTYEEGPGSHSWEFWDNRIKEVLEWLPLS